jgi:protein tyrosine phosphatase (PTP) superfamily phosphohydrolase (DUF442 family)
LSMLVVEQMAVNERLVTGSEPGAWCGCRSKTPIRVGRIADAVVSQSEPLSKGRALYRASRMTTAVVRTAALFALALVAGATTRSDGAETTGPAPIHRFSQVDARLYRGAQPDPEGLRYLSGLGVRLVINLRDPAEARRIGEQQMVESLGMRYVNLPVDGGNFFVRSRKIPETTFREFLALMETEARPVFVHCRRGADRTGAIVGLYRIARHGWSGGRAYEEARQLGMRSWYTGFKRQLQEFGESAPAGRATLEGAASGRQIVPRAAVR